MKKSYLLLTVLFLLSISSFAQKIPNNGFEDWTTVGSFEMPDYWDNLNPVTEPSGIFTCTRGTPGSPGTAFLNLTSTLIPGTGVVPGIAVCGVLDQVSRLPVSGFAFQERPELFTGRWQYMMFGTGKGFMDVLLTKWDTLQSRRDTIAYKHYILNGMVMSWQNFSVPLTYISGSYPDSCIIFLSASGAVAADFDYLWVDNLAFSGNVITSLPPSEVNGMEIRIFPNPTSGKTRIRYYNGRGENVNIRLTNERGIIVKEHACKSVQGENEFIMNLEGVSPAVYFLTVRSSSGSETTKMVIL
jgi:hypothetical protein